MSLGTYEIEDLSVIGQSSGDDVPISPGSIVCHNDYRRSSCGIIIAIDEHHALVLWSRVPPRDVSEAALKAALACAAALQLQGPR